MPHLSYRLLVTSLACITWLGLSIAPASSQETQTWGFEYFAGDPPVWHDHPEVFPLKAACEIARAEKTAAGYPVKECTVRGSASTATPKTTPKKSTSSQTTTTGEVARTAAQIEAARQRKLAEGCRVACDTDLEACTQAIVSGDSCVQQENARCIERCTSVEQLPHHQCINEVCLPDEVNTATWKGMCETLEERARTTCQSTHTTCSNACGS